MVQSVTVALFIMANEIKKMASVPGVSVKSNSVNCISQFRNARKLDIAGEHSYAYADIPEANWVEEVAD